MSPVPKEADMFFSRGKKNKSENGPSIFAPIERDGAASSPAVEKADPMPPSAPAAGSTPHTLRAVDVTLDQLIAEASDMGAHVLRMAEDCVGMFLNHDANAAQRLIQSDLVVDKMYDAVIVRAVEILTRYQPVASDLRLIFAIEHAAGDLERAADHAKNIAKRSLSLPKGTALDSAIPELITHLHRAVTGMLRDALTALSARDITLAADVLRRDQEPDAIYDDLFYAVIARIQTDSSSAAADIQALFVGKSLERIGDHATNIAEQARFLAHGQLPSATRSQEQ
jgi:phosphate transport system protein